MDEHNEVLIAPDFLALGLGGTNMMSMLWTVAMGRQAVGVEMRGDPFLGVHWNIREDFYHQLGLIDQMMLERYGEARLPRRSDGRIFRLAECFYSPYTQAGDIVADEIIDGFDADQHIVGTIHNVEFIDDRWRDGLPNRVITVLNPPTPPDQADPRKIRASMAEVLDGPSTFQAEAASIQKLLRRYLELLEQQDRETKSKPRVQLFTHHRVIPTEGEQTLLRTNISIGSVVPESAKTYAFLDIQQNEQVVQRIAITEHTVLVGRADPKRGITPKIDLTPFDTSSSVSRQHARIHLEKDCFFIEDLDSRNKTRLDGLTLTPHEREKLQNGDGVSFGSVKATFHLLGTSELPVSWSQS